MAQLYKDGRPDIRGHRPNKSVMLCDDDDDDDDDHNYQDYDDKYNHNRHDQTYLK